MLITMGTKVMVRATRSFDDKVDGEWYWVDPDNARDRSLIAGGYFEHQETLPIEPLPPDPEFNQLVKRYVSTGPAKRGKRGKVEAEPGQHHEDGAS